MRSTEKIPISKVGPAITEVYAGSKPYLTATALGYHALGVATNAGARANNCPASELTKLSVTSVRYLTKLLFHKVFESSTLVK
jgi:hypothetical protein